MPKEKIDPENQLIQIDLLNISTRQEFTKGYDTVTQAQNFLYRCRYSKKLIVLGVRSWSPSAMEELRI